jgi:hypothetical protein
MCSDVIWLQQCQNYGKKELETMFRLFCNNVNQQMLNYRKTTYSFLAPSLKSYKFTLYLKSIAGNIMKCEILLRKVGFNVIQELKDFDRKPNWTEAMMLSNKYSII